MSSKSEAIIEGRQRTMMSVAKRVVVVWATALALVVGFAVTSAPVVQAAEPGCKATGSSKKAHISGDTGVQGQITVTCSKPYIFGELSAKTYFNWNNNATGAAVDSIFQSGPLLYQLWTPVDGGLWEATFNTGFYKDVPFVGNALMIVNGLITVNGVTSPILASADVF